MVKCIMTVNELMDQLQELDGELEVYIQHSLDSDPLGVVGLAIAERQSAGPRHEQIALSYLADNTNAKGKLVVGLGWDPATQI